MPMLRCSKQEFASTLRKQIRMLSLPDHLARKQAQTNPTYG